MPRRVRRRGLTEKTFIILSQEAIESVTIEEARATYKSIKSKTNSVYPSFKESQKALVAKVAINEQIEDLEEEIDDSPNDEELQNELDELLAATATISLIRELEKAYNVKPKSFVNISDSTVKISDYIIDQKAIKNEKKKSKFTMNLDDDLDDNRTKKSVPNSVSPKKKSVSKQNFKNYTKKPKISHDTDTDSDDDYDNLAVYQSEVYNNKQMILSKRNGKKKKIKKSKSPKKNKKKKSQKTKSNINLIETVDIQPHPHENNAIKMRANDANWDRDWDKIQKKRDEIKEIKAARKDNNSLKIRNQKSTAKIYANPHSKNAKVMTANAKNWDRDWEKITRQRAEIKRLKEKRKKEKENKNHMKRTSSFKHPHDQ